MSTPRSPRDELAEGTEVGGLYLSRLVRAQLSLSVLALVSFGALLGALPLALLVVPWLGRTQLLGVPLALWLVGVPMFVVFVAVGWIYQHRADELDEEFGEFTRGREP